MKFYRFHISALYVSCRTTAENFYTEVNDITASVHSSMKQQGSSNASLTPGALQKCFPPLPPMPSCLKMRPINAGKQAKQIVKSASLHCMLNSDDGLFRRDALKVSSIDCLDTKEKLYDDVVVATAKNINGNAPHEDHEEYQLMLKSADNVDATKTALECKVMLLASKYAEIQNASSS